MLQRMKKDDNIKHINYSGCYSIRPQCRRNCSELVEIASIVFVISVMSSDDVIQFEMISITDMMASLLHLFTVVVPIVMKAIDIQIIISDGSSQ